MATLLALGLGLALAHAPACDEAAPALPGSSAPAPGARQAWLHAADAWWRRRQRLIAGVVVSGLVALAGASLIIPEAVSNDEEGSGALIVSAPLFMTIGGVATLVTGSFLGHHLRWDRPSQRRRSAPWHEAYRARTQRQRLLVTLIAGSSTALAGGLAGGLAVGLGWASAFACPDTQDSSCVDPRIIGGWVVGGPLMLGGVVTAASSAILIGLLKSHGHMRARPWGTVGLTPGGVKIRF